MRTTCKKQYYPPPCLRDGFVKERQVVMATANETGNASQSEKFITTTDKARFDFLNGFFLRTLEEYPHLKGQFALIDLKERTVFDSFDLSRRKDITPEIYQFALAFFAAHEGEGHRAFAGPVIFPSTDGIWNWGNAIAAAPAGNSHITKLMGPHEPSFVLYHELGHLVVKGAGAYVRPEEGVRGSAADGNFAETAADIYGLLRIRKEHGQEAFEQMAEASALLTRNLLLWAGDTRHFSAWAVEDLVKATREPGFCDPSLKEIEELAFLMAQKHALPEATLAGLHKNFARFNTDEKNEAAGNPLLLMACAHLTADPLTFRLTHEYLADRLKFHGVKDEETLAAAKDLLFQYKARDMQDAKEDLLSVSSLSPDFSVKSPKFSYHYMLRSNSGP